MLALDSTRLSGQAQTASLPMGRGITKVYSTGDIVDNSYRLISLLGTGGMGVVFHCQHLILGKEYALKLLAADKLSAESWKRFQSEAKALARLHHPGVVGIHNMGIDAQECPYYVMDLLEGESLSQIIKANHRLPQARALSIFIQLADALDSAHQQGIIHRDIKPSNVMVLAEKSGDKVKLVDFGIARLSNRDVSGAFNSQNKTAAGTVFGTPYYMSPEQSLGKPVDNRSDIYSLGCALFEALTGIPPFCGANAFETILMHQSNEAPSLNSVYPEGKFPNSLESAVAKMLNKNVDERYQSMKQVGHDLSRVAAGKSIGFKKIESRTEASRNFREEEEVVVERNYSSPRPRSKNRQPKLSATASAAIAAAIVLIAIGATTICIAAKGTFTRAGNSENAEKSADETEVEDKPSDERAMMSQDPDLVVLKQHLKKHKQFVSQTVDDQGNPIRRFIFPEHYIGYINWGGNEPRKAVGTIDVPIKEKVSLYLQCVCTPYPKLCEKFGKDDISRLEIVTFSVKEVIGYIRNWTALEHLSFYNSLERTKGIDTSEILKENVPLLDQFTNLKTLGLCGETVMGKPLHGEEIEGSDLVNLKPLSTVNHLMLKEIKNIQPLLAEIKNHSNIKELTLDSLDINDADIKLLSTAQELETLHLLQCPNVTAKSAPASLNMKKLRNLYMDQKWPEETKQSLAAQVKAYHYEDYSKGRHR